MPYLLDPIVTINFVNHTVLMLGEVNKKQSLVIPADHALSILEAFALSVMLRGNADVKRVLIIRQEENNEKQFKYVNLTNEKFMNSSWFYLKPNDIVYVPTDYKRVDKQTQLGIASTNIGLFATLVSLTIIIVTQLK